MSTINNSDQQAETQRHLADLHRGAKKALEDGHYALAAALSRACDQLAAIVRNMTRESVERLEATRMIPLVGTTRDEQPARYTDPAVTMSHAPNSCATCGVLIKWNDAFGQWQHQGFGDKGRDADHEPGPTA